jgi:uncharacterized protein (TIGR02145 family)
MNMIKNSRIYLVFLLFLSFAFSGCVKEPISNEIDTDDEVMVVIRLPHSSRGNTPRAITQDGVADNMVNRVDILIFYTDTDPVVANRGRYVGRVFSNIIEGDGNIKTFKVRMPRGTYDLLVLANAKDIVDAAALVIGETLKTGTDTSADRLLIASLPGRPTDPYVIRAWNNNPSSLDFQPFPMWGEVLSFTPETANGATEQGKMNVDLIRALAKINVRFANQTAKDKLTVANIALFNFNSGGYLVSRGYNQNATNVSQQVSDAMTTPSSHGYSNAIPYTVAGTGLDVSVDEIFLFEVKAAASAEDAIALIIGGYYGGSSTRTYYRIDMVNSAGEYFDIIRNYYYDVNITAINGPGYNDATEAANSKPFNITSTIEALDFTGMNNHTYNGQYQITVDFDDFTFDPDGTAQTIRIFTDVPGGWTIEIPAESNWITNPTTTTTGIRDVITPLTITCAANGTNMERTGSFFIVAGALRKEITVTQDVAPGVPINGIRWAEANVSQFGTFADDPQDAGMFYQWNRPTAWASTGTVPSWNSTEAAGTVWASANDPCPAGWRIPTQAELRSLTTAAGNWVNDWNGTGVAGHTFGTAPNQIFMPAPGYRNATGALISPNTRGQYWSNESDTSASAWSLYFDSYTSEYMSPIIRSFGFAVRCVLE